MRKAVFLLDGPIGVGKTTLGRDVAARLRFGFIDGDDLSDPGPWLRSILRTSRRIVEAGEEALRHHDGVIVAYPLRCTNWLFFRQSFGRRGIACHCVGLIADSAAIEARDRPLDTAERARSREMIAQGYGQRPFSDLILRTDEAGRDTTARRLADAIRPFAGAR